MRNDGWDNLYRNLLKGYEKYLLNMIIGNEKSRINVLEIVRLIIK